MTVCLAVIGLLDIICAPSAEPIGDCWQPINGVLACTAEPWELPIRASWYNPLLGGINCDKDCRYVADGTLSADCFNWCLACPLGWEPHYKDGQFIPGKVIDFGPHVGVWQCRDVGGAIHHKYGRWYTSGGFTWEWVIVVDFMTYHEPEWAYWLFEGVHDA